MEKIKNGEEKGVGNMIEVIYEPNQPSISASETKGGIAFGNLPIQIQAGSALSTGTVPLSSARIDRAGTVPVDLEAEWIQIQQIFNAGIRPSIDRLSRYSLAASASHLSEEKIDQVRGMLADILRRDEESERLAPADEACKELLKRLEA